MNKCMKCGGPGYMGLQKFECDTCDAKPVGPGVWPARDKAIDAARRPGKTDRVMGQLEEFVRAAHAAQDAAKTSGEPLCTCGCGLTLKQVANITGDAAKATDLSWYLPKPEVEVDYSDFPIFLNSPTRSVYITGIMAEGSTPLKPDFDPADWDPCQNFAGYQNAYTGETITYQEWQILTQGMDLTTARLKQDARMASKSLDAASGYLYEIAKLVGLGGKAAYALSEVVDRVRALAAGPSKP